MRQAMFTFRERPKVPALLHQEDIKIHSAVAKMHFWLSLIQMAIGFGRLTTEVRVGTKAFLCLRMHQTMSIWLVKLPAVPVSRQGGIKIRLEATATRSLSNSIRRGPVNGLPIMVEQVLTNLGIRQLMQPATCTCQAKQPVPPASLQAAIKTPMEVATTMHS